MDYTDLVYELETARHEAKRLLSDKEAEWVSLDKQHQALRHQALLASRELVRKLHGAIALAESAHSGWSDA